MKDSLAKIKQHHLGGFFSATKEDQSNIGDTYKLKKKNPIYMSVIRKKEGALTITRYSSE